MILSKNVSLISAFFMEGLHDAGYDQAIQSWDQGCVGLIEEMISHAPFAEKLCVAVAEGMKVSWPGVFDYEVSAPFGHWFGDYVIEHSNTPSKLDAEAWLVNAIEKFFSQGADAHEIVQIKTVIAEAREQTESDVDYRDAIVTTTIALKECLGFVEAWQCHLSDNAQFKAAKTVAVVLANAREKFVRATNFLALVKL